MKRTLLIIGFVVLAVVAVVGWTQALRLKARAEKSEAILVEKERINIAAHPYDPATFVRFENDTLYYRVPQQVQVDGQTFVNQVDVSAPINPNLHVFGVQGNDGPGALLQLNEGAPIRISVKPRNGGGVEVNLVYVLQ
jgi:hypothetical protein